MESYIEILFEKINEVQSELLIAELNQAGFTGFEEEEGLLKAFIADREYNEEMVQDITIKYGLDFKKTLIAATNWNAVWESNFDPVIIGDFAGIRAFFHPAIENVKHEIVITPKMSFGTGHHATTDMMIRHMEQIDFNGKTVFDFGTGTGILAILAEKLGASRVLAIDNDEWSIENAKENGEKNHCIITSIENAGDANRKMNFDIILANINKNIILSNLVYLLSQLNPGGILLISGLLEEDEKDIMTEVHAHEGKLMGKLLHKGWISLRIEV